MKLFGRVLGSTGTQPTVKPVLPQDTGTVTRLNQDTGSFNRTAHESGAAARLARSTGRMPAIDPWSPLMLELFERAEPDSLFASPAQEKAYFAATLEDCTFPKIVGLLSEDIALVRRIRALANSARFGRAGHLMGIKTSVGRVGLDGVRELLLVVCTEGKLAIPEDKGTTTRLQARAPAVAFAARALAPRAKVDPFEAFLAGLFHDLGWAIAYRIFDEFAAIAADRLPPDDIERRACAIASHPALGAAQIEQWNLGPRVAGAIRHHHRPRDAGDAAGVANVVRAAMELCDIVGFQLDDMPRDPAGPIALSAIGLDGQGLSRAIADLRRDLELDPGAATVSTTLAGTGSWLAAGSDDKRS